MMETSSKDKNIDKTPKENLREPDGEESNLLFTDEYKEAFQSFSESYTYQNDEEDYEIIPETYIYYDESDNE